MKTLSALCEPVMESMKQTNPVVCDYFMSPEGCIPLQEPVLSTQHECLFCGGSDHHSPFVDPTKSDKRVWLCGNINCDVYKRKSRVQATHVPPTPKRALEWPKFCEINDIGDLFHDVKFEKIEQPTGKIDYLFKFGNKPFGLIFMQGTPGSGKTYACMGVCELFTRRSTSAIFTTQTKMFNDWLDTFKSEKISNYIDRVKGAELLVIDDFGTGEVSDKFMIFFMELINTRLQWSNRGTIITTNLDDRKFSEFCGNALNDRIKTGQKFEFKDKSRRKQMIL